MKVLMVGDFDTMRGFLKKFFLKGLSFREACNVGAGFIPARQVPMGVDHLISEISTEEELL